MSILSFFFNYVFLLFILPLYVIFLIGKPIFILKILDKILHLRIPGRKEEIFDILIFFCIISDGYFYYKKYNLDQRIGRIYVKKAMISPDEFQSLITRSKSNERNCYIFLTYIAILFTIQKLCQRHIRIHEMKQEKENKKIELAKIDPVKDPMSKKND